LQESFWQVWQRAPDYRPELGSPFCWIVTVARRKAIDRLRANSRHLQRIEDAQGARTEDDFASPAALESLAADERGTAVRAALAKLGPDERRAIALAFFDGLTHVEIAAVERAPVGTINLPATNLWNMRFAKRVRLQNGRTLEGRFDFFNIFNVNFITNESTRVGPTYLIPSGTILPRILQMGVTYTF